MRILHIQHPYLPGLGYQENYLPFRQCDLGHEVKIATSKITPEKFKDLNQNPNQETNPQGEVEITRLPKIKYFNSIDQVLLRGLNSEIREFKPDIIHSHGLVNFLSTQSLIANYNYDFKLFIDIHVDNGNTKIDSYPKKGLFTLYNNLFHPLLDRGVARYLPVQYYAKQFLQERLSIPENRMSILPLGADKQKFYPHKESRSKIRNELKIDQETALVIFAGNMVPEKNIETLIESFNLINKQFQGVKLLLLGNGPNWYMNNIQRKVEQFSLTNNVIFHNFVPHSRLMEYYNAADIGVFPGKLGITAIEAIATGLPIIVPDSKATQFLIENNNGLTFSRDNATSLQQAIHSLVQDETLRKEKSIKSVELVEKRLCWSAIAKRSIEIYQS